MHDAANDTKYQRQLRPTVVFLNNVVNPVSYSITAKSTKASAKLMQKIY